MRLVFFDFRLGAQNVTQAITQARLSGSLSLCLVVFCSSNSNLAPVTNVCLYIYGSHKLGFLSIILASCLHSLLRDLCSPSVLWMKLSWLPSFSLHKVEKIKNIIVFWLCFSVASATVSVPLFFCDKKGEKYYCVLMLTVCEFLCGGTAFSSYLSQSIS